MDIEKLIEQANRFGMELRRDGGEFEYSIGEKFLNYATALSTLQAENANLHDELEKVEAERDAAVNDLNILRKRSGWKCYACFYDDHYDRGVCAGCGYNNDNNWQWRGQKED